MPSRFKPLSLTLFSLASPALLAGCGATVHQVALAPPASTGSVNGIQVIDSRLEADLKVAMAHGSGGGFILVQLNPNLADSLQRWVAKDYAGPRPLYVGVERLEVTYGVGFATKDDLSCGIESQVRVAGDTGKTVRTQVRNTENMSPLVSTAIRVIVNQCIEVHAADIVRTR